MIGKGELMKEKQVYGEPGEAVALSIHYMSRLDGRVSWRSRRMRKSRLTIFTALVATFGYLDVKDINIIWG